MARKRPTGGVSSRGAAVVLVLGVVYNALFFAVYWMAEQETALRRVLLLCAAVVGAALAVLSVRALWRDPSPPVWEQRAEELLQRQAEEKLSADMKKTETKE